MRTYKNTTVPAKELVSVFCDHCGKDTAGPQFTQEGTTLRWSHFGYGSRFDCEQWDEFDLCDDCCEELRAWVTPQGGDGNKDTKEKV